MFISLLDRDVQETDLACGYFLYGQESFLAHQFVGQLRTPPCPPKKLPADKQPDGLQPSNKPPEDMQPMDFERFWMDEADWTEVIDAARTAPLFITPRKLIVAEFLPREDDQGKDRPEDKLSEVEEKVLADYFASPSPRTVVVIIYPRSTWNAKSAPVFKLFTRQLADRVVSRELKPLKDKGLRAWLERSLRDRKLALTPEAKARLEEVVGNDLQQLSSEMDKLISFSARKPVINAEDVELVCGWTRSPENWELSDALTGSDLASCLKVLDSLFKSGEEGIKVLNSVIRFFQEILQAKGWLREKAKDRKEIFRAIKPNIKENYVKLYTQKFHDFFSLVDGLSGRELGLILDELSRIDRLAKSSDVSVRILLEGFMVEYCRRLTRPPAMRFGRS